VQVFGPASRLGLWPNMRVLVPSLRDCVKTPANARLLVLGSSSDSTGVGVQSLYGLWPPQVAAKSFIFSGRAGGLEPGEPDLYNFLRYIT